MSKHTPGPWMHLPCSEDGFIIRASHKCIVGAADEEDWYGPIWNEANARLIAAAPDLLEALKIIVGNNCPLTGNPSRAELVEHWEYEKSQGRGEADDHLFALAAIAKATGDSDD